MPEIIWKKYEKLKEIKNKNTKIKTYLARIQPIIKEIIPKDKYEYIRISEKLEKLRNEIKLFDIIEENEAIYVVLENNEELCNKVDELLSPEKLDIKKEVKTEGHATPINKNEIMELFKMDKSMCKIETRKITGEKGTGSGFFCKLSDENIPFKYALFTNNHVLNESNLDIGKTIKLEYLEMQKYLFNKSYNLVKKEIIITEKRKFFTNKNLDYTCIELFESDGIKDFFEIDPALLKYSNEILKNNDIFILQYPNGNELSFSSGIIKDIKGNIFIHTASTEGGSSGSPIIRRSEKNYIIGIHFGGKENEEKENINLAVDFQSVLDDINKQIKSEISEINCIYIADKDKNEINLLNDYNGNFFNDELQKIYLEAKNTNKSLFEKNIELYINDKKTKFEFKYKTGGLKEIKVKFKFKKRIIKNTNFMFFRCSSLKSINLDLSSYNTNMRSMFCHCSSLESIMFSPFDTSNVTDMSYMFCGCSSLKSLDLSSFNTSNVKYMKKMFDGCKSLKSLDLSLFNTSNINNMKKLFYECSSLESLNLSSFNTSNVIDMSYMFCRCSSLKSIDLSSFDTYNVNNMKEMFHECSSLKSIDLSSFDTSNVTDMSYMFSFCKSLESINLISFKTINVNNMSSMFHCCNSLKSLNLSSFNTSKVNEMRYMFFSCESLTSLNLSSFNSGNVKYMACMFKDCGSLLSIDLSSFETSNVKSMREMFSSCRSLKSITVFHKVVDSLSH